MCQVGVTNEGWSSSTLIGLPNDCKWVFNEASLMPWCHAVVHFEVKMTHFSACFQEDRPESSRQWPVCHVCVLNEGSTKRTWLIAQGLAIQPRYTR